MPNSSRANSRRKRIATQKLEKYRERIATGEPRDEGSQGQDPTYGMPGHLGSGTQLGSAAHIHQGSGEGRKDQ